MCVGDGGEICGVDDVGAREARGERSGGGGFGGGDCSEMCGVCGELVVVIEYVEVG